MTTEEKLAELNLMIKDIEALSDKYPESKMLLGLATTQLKMLAKSLSNTIEKSQNPKAE